MVRKATWQRHADQREWLRGTEVTFTDIYLLYIGYSTYKRSIEELTNLLFHLTLYTRHVPLFFSVWDYVPLFYFNFRLHGVTWSVSWESR